MQLRGKHRHGNLTTGLLALAVVAAGAVGVPAGAEASTAQAGTAAPTGTAAPARDAVQRLTTYRNPVTRNFADTYADPWVIRAPDGWYYGYGTSDPLRAGGPRSYIPMSRSRDLVHWQYAGDAFTRDTLPRYADKANDASLWAPDVHYVNGQWRMYYVVTQTTVNADLNDNVIGMATAPTPLGPWTDTGKPVVGPRRGASGKPGDYLWTYDPAYVRDTNGRDYLFYGSYYGGIFTQQLDRTGTRTVSAPKRIAIDNKFEGTYITRRNGYWYFFGSTANCCAGPTTGYSVEVARSRSLLGPYVDRDGQRIDVGGETGGTPVLYQNGNRWIGTGHNTMATDDTGQDWILYHAIDRNDPFLVGTSGINRRPMLADRLDWVGGWPVVRYGCGPSDSPQLGPIVDRRRTAAGAAASSAAARATGFDCLPLLSATGLLNPPGRLDRADSDEFNGGTLASGWQRLRDPQVTVAGGTLNWTTEAKDLVGATNDAGVLLRRPPAGDWTVETKLTLDLGADEIRNFQQAGLVAYVNDDLFVRLDKVAIFNTRQIEFGHEIPYAGATSYGGTIVGAPARTTWLRIVKRTNPSTGEILLTPFSSRDGRTWTRGGTWTLPAGSDVKVGLVSHGASAAPDAPAPAVAQFDYFRLYRP